MKDQYLYDVEKGQLKRYRVHRVESDGAIITAGFRTVPGSAWYASSEEGAIKQAFEEAQEDLTGMFQELEDAKTTYECLRTTYETLLATTPKTLEAFTSTLKRTYK